MKTKTDWHKCYLVAHRDNMKLATRNVELVKKIQAVCKAWAQAKLKYATSGGWAELDDRIIELERLTRG